MSSATEALCASPQPMETSMKPEDIKFDLTLLPLYHDIANREPLTIHTVRRVLKGMITTGYRSDSPITMYKGQILDGRNRYVAANALKLTPTYREFKGTNEEAIQESKNLNRYRRHNNKSQDAMQAAYELVDFEEQLALVRSEIREKNPKISTRSLNEKSAKSDIYIQFGGRPTPETLSKEYGVSADYIKKCKKYLNYNNGTLSEMCANIFDGELEIYQAEEKYQTARQAFLSANRIARQMTEEESLLYEKIELARTHPEAAAREIIQLMSELEQAENVVDRKHEELETIKDKVTNTIAENIVLGKTLEAVNGNIDPEEHY